ncbi:MAG: amino acid ABC transporter permease [Actinobacteria bacterium]|nr:amino acid ABC transporter permease [Actinomycetota bacterium]
MLVGARGDGARSTLVALVSTLVVGTLLVLFVTRSPGWDAVRAGFFDGAIFRTSLPEIAGAFLLNVKIFSIVEAIVLVAALLLAVVRSLPGPAFFPLRMLAIAYCDVFRGIPTILLILLLGFGVPGLQIDGAPTSPVFWSIVALSLVYTAYVSEVYRAGIDSVHPSQDAAARSLGLTRAQSLRFVVVPQAVRRVIPPLLNDFIGLQKDTALVSILGAVESLRQAQIDTAATFNFTPYLAVALLFLVITIPLTRLTDWLIARDRRRRLAGGVR